MNRAQLFNAHTPANGKITRLHQLLLKEKNLFEEVAGHVHDNALRCTILSLAQQNNQYAAELSCYLQSTGSTGNLSGKRQYRPKDSSAKKYQLPDESNALAFCSSNERKIVAAYRKILKESALYEGLKNMMGYQLSGSLSSFVQLKLLNSVKKRHGVKHLAGIVN